MLSGHPSRLQDGLCSEKTILAVTVFLIVGLAVFSVAVFSDPKVSFPKAIEESSACPAAGCASGACYGFDAVPKPDGVYEMTCLEVGCATVECHAWDTLSTRCYQPSDASLNLWVLAPVVLVAGLVLLVWKLLEAIRACEEEPCRGPRCPCGLPSRGQPVACRRAVPREWLSLGLLVVFFVHAAAHVPWAVDAMRGVRQTTGGVRGNPALDALVLAAFAVVMVSGFGTSGEALRAFGCYADGYYFWNPLHAIAVKVLLTLLLVYVVVQIKWSYQVLCGKGVAASRLPGDGSRAASTRKGAKGSEGHHVR